MAQMIPNIVSPDIKSNAERKIFSWFRNDPKTVDWVVLHSLGISQHRKFICGETDFLVLVPNRGLFALEVKGGRVARKDGKWIYTDKYGNTHSKPRGPFEQAKDSIFSIIDKIKRTPDLSCRNLRNVFFGFGVMFPDIEYEASGVDEEQSQVFDVRDGHKVGEFVERLFSYYQAKWERLHGSIEVDRFPTHEDIKYIAGVLRPDFDFLESLESQIKGIETNILHYTQEQFKCLDQLEDNARCLIMGLAGTGKTLLAVEETKRSVFAEYRTALFCYNANLAKWLSLYFKSAYADYCPDYVGTFHKFLLSVLPNDKKIAFKINANRLQTEIQTYYEQELPKEAKAVLETLPKKFEKVVIDEAQDIICPRNLEVLDSMLVGGIDRGKWSMFGDFSMQTIFSSYDGSQLVDNLEQACSFAKFKLLKNCRNTKPIFLESSLFFNLEDLTLMSPEIKGPPVNLYTYSDIQEHSKKLDELIIKTKNENIPLDEITVISPFRFENSAVRYSRFAFNRNLFLSLNIPRFSTIQSFKGLESKVIVVIDISTLSDANLIYTAFSRARIVLHVFMSTEAYHEYLNLKRRRIVECG